MARIPALRLRTTTFGVVLTVSACLTAMQPATAGGGVSGVSWSVTDAPFALSFSSSGTPLVAQPTSATASPAGGMAYELADGTVHTVTSLISEQPTAAGTTYDVGTDEANRTAIVAVTHTAQGVHVAWSFQPASGVETVFSALRSPAAREHFVGTGIDSEHVDLDGEIEQIKVAYSCDRSVVTPFFASSAGYGVYYETSTVGQIEFRGTHDGMACDDSNSEHPLCGLVSAPDRVEACFKTSSLAFDVFAGTPDQILGDFRATVGPAAAPPSAEFGLIKWRDQVATGNDVLDDVQQLQRLGIPLGSVLVDNPWETAGCLGALSFDPVRFPDPAALIRSVHARGVGFMVWVSPYVEDTASCARYVAIPPRSTLSGRGSDAIVDFTNAQGRAAYASAIARLVDMGVDGFKGDRADEVDLEGDSLAGGSGVALHNDYPSLFAQTVVAGAHQAGLRSPVTMFRAGSTATLTTGVGVWAGDQTPDFPGMKAAIRSLLTLGASGFAVSGSDVGGYATAGGSPSLTADVFARWSQLGAISPIFEIGGADRAARFWTLGAAATSVARASVLLHYALIPYLAGLAESAAHTGSPILQPLGMEWPDDEQAWRADLELLLGQDVLAAPVVSDAAKTRVYLPAGDWTNLFAGTRITGPTSVVRTVPLDQFPLYLRSGTAIPFDLRTPDLWTQAWPLDALAVPGRGGWLYAPDSGTAVAASSGHGAFTATTDDGEIDIGLSGAPRETELLVALPTRPRAVTIAGANVAESSSVTTLRRAASGWVWTDGPFPGALIKLAPRGGAATLTITPR